MTADSARRAWSPSEESRLSRRRVLAGVGSAAAVGLAGCVNLIGAEQFSDVVVRIKGDSTPVTLAVEVTGSGETTLSETIETDEVDTQGFDDVWQGTGAYTLRAEMDDGIVESHTAEVATEDDSLWVTAEDEETITFDLKEG
jgi:hypothetical protein